MIWFKITYKQHYVLYTWKLFFTLNSSWKSSSERVLLLQITLFIFFLLAISRETEIKSNNSRYSKKMFRVCKETKTRWRTKNQEGFNWRTEENIWSWSPFSTTSESGRNKNQWARYVLQNIFQHKLLTFTDQLYNLWVRAASG